MRTSAGIFGPTASVPSANRTESPESFQPWFASPRPDLSMYSKNSSPPLSPYSTKHGY